MFRGKPKITISYQDENFKSYTETYEGLIARVIQHEYDHRRYFILQTNYLLKKKTNQR